MAQSKTTRTVAPATATQTGNAQSRITSALTQAATQAKKQLASQGLKLPTQTWTSSSIRNPAV
jgi:hypothetical protein